jgi:hypothetical protein
VDNNTVAENSFRRQLSFIGGEVVGAGTSQMFDDAEIGSENIAPQDSLGYNAVHSGLYSILN